MRLISFALLVVLIADPARAADADPSSPSGARSAETPVASVTTGAASGVAPSTRLLDWTDVQTARIALGAEGGVGLFAVPGADLGRQGVLRVGLVGDGFATHSFPVQGGVERFVGSRVQASWVALPFLEAYANLATRSSLSNRSTPALIQSVGDFKVGVKGVRHLGHAFFGGVDANLRAYPGTLQLTRYAYAFTPQLLAGFDARQLSRYVPLRLHVAAGVRVDWNTQQSDTQLRAAEEFALDSNRYPRFLFGAGAEVPLPWVTPFAEYTLSLPLGIPPDGLISPNGLLLSSRQAMVETLNFGAKVTAVRDFTFLAAVQLGLNRNVTFGVPQAPPFQFTLGISYTADLTPRPATSITVVQPMTTRTLPAPRPPWLSGRVLDANRHVPIGDALIHFTEPAYPPVASETKSGQYRTYPLAGDRIRLRVTHDGYASEDFNLTLAEGENEADLLLTALPPKSILELHTTSKGRPIPAQVTLQSGGVSRTLVIPPDGVATLELDPGEDSLAVFATGYLSQTREVQMPGAGRILVAFDLKPVPQRPAVELKGSRLELKQSVQFASGKARILSDSHALLGEVVDVLVRNRLALVRIEGHTDNKGSAAFNQKLSEERARAVLEYLVSQGVDRAHLESQGFGGGRPVAPNLTARGRELNRRVDFIVLKR